MELKYKVLLAVLQRALWGTGEIACLPDLDLITNEASTQGVQSFLFPGAKGYGDLFPLEKRKEWRSTMLACALRNDEVNAAQRDIIGILSDNGIRAAVLKGLSVARYYPKPEIRALGDIDLLVDVNQLRAVDNILREQGYTVSDSAHVFHRDYHKNGIIVEVHHAVTDTPVSKGGRAAATMISSFLDHAELVEVCDTQFLTLSESHQALMLLLHMERHMVEKGIGLRQLCDWAVYINSVDPDNWHTKTSRLLAECGLLFYAQVITKVCVTYLGLDAEKNQWCMGVETALVDAMMADVFQHGNLGVNNKRDVSDLFTDRRTLGQGKKNRLQRFISKLTSVAYKRYPITQQYRVLLPALWLFISVRYLVKWLSTSKDRHSFLQMVSESNERQELCRSLKLYEVE